MRIGLISDTHIPEACEHLPSRVFEVFRGVDLVMHAGDVYVNRVLDELAEIAPVIAALGNGDEGLDGHQFQRPTRVSTEGMSNVRTRNVSIRMPAAIAKPIC